MFCLRSWLPLLFIPTTASPIFILTFFTCTYFLNRPCVYCSILLIILFASSCQWSEFCVLGKGGSEWFVGSGSAIAEGVGKEWTGLGVGWLRGLCGGREWRVEGLDVWIRL